MDIYLLFRVLSVASILTSTLFDVLQIMVEYDIYLVLAFIFLFITSIIPSILKHNPDPQSLLDVIFDRNFYFVPSTMLILVFKAMALYHASNRTNMTISVWTYILGSFTAHYMKEPEYIQLEEKVPRRDFFIFKPLVLSFAFWICMGFHERTTYEMAMKYVLLASLALYAYSEILILLINELFMKYFCGLNRWILVKPLHLVTACISLAFASFFYEQSWIPIPCIFIVIHLTHFL